MLLRAYEVFMHFTLSRKIISLLLVFILIFSSSLTLVSCNIAEDSTGDGASGDSGTSGGGSGDGSGDTKPKEDYHDKIKVPEYKDYERDTINFSDITYERPNIDAAISAFNNVIGLIEENTISFEDQIAAIEALEPTYSSILTMNAFAQIYNSKDSSNEFFATEHAYISENYPAFAQTIEKMYVAAANSPHAERFEDEYFGEELIEEYRDGGILSDNMVKLLADEAALEAQYSSISTATTEVTFKGDTDTVDNLLGKYKRLYAEGSKEYTTAYTAIMQAYEYKVEDICTEIFVSLVQIRRLIADELGHDSYITYAYDNFERDYTPSQMSAFLDDISEHILPAYAQLYSYVFYYYFLEATPGELQLDTLINGTYDTLEIMDEELHEAFSYMLQHKLYDVELTETNRMPGAFTTYLYDYNAPFIFMSASGDASDYSTLFHEFGHFADYYINYGDDTSIDQSEVSSQGLELIMLEYLSGRLSEDDAQYLKYNALCSALEVLIYQGFYARCEELIYSIPYDDITKANLDRAVTTAAGEFGFNTKYVNSISFIFMTHTFLYPFYVQSYCTSVVPALELYFMECEEEGAGLAAYLKVIDRNCETELTFEETLVAAGLSSPFEEGLLAKLADDIYYAIMGAHINKDKSAA